MVPFPQEKFTQRVGRRSASLICVERLLNEFRAMKKRLVTLSLSLDLTLA
jgi:hypothetical protein